MKEGLVVAGTIALLVALYIFGRLTAQLWAAFQRSLTAWAYRRVAWDKAVHGDSNKKKKHKKRHDSGSDDDSRSGSDSDSRSRSPSPNPRKY